jgi:hypothetical protein
MNTRTGRALLLIALLFSVSSCVLAQATGSIHGVVHDASGAVVAGAQIVVTDIAAGLNRTLATNAQGEYLAPLLPVGQYQVQVEMQGFQSVIQKEIVVAVNTDVQVDATLAVAGAAAEVTVTSAPPLLQTTTTNLVQVVGQQEMVDLPLNGRNVLQLTALAAGITNDPRVAEGVLQGATVGQGFYNVVISANGSRPNQNNYLLDNVDNNDNYTNINAPYPNPDAVEEFSVQTSSFNAEYGRGVGAVVNVVSKTGTNKLHGSAYDFLRNNDLNARNYFTGLDTLKRNQFGVSLGGPVVLPKLYNGKNRTFFFGSYEGTRQRASNAQSVTAPTAAMEQGDLSAFLGPNGKGVVYDPLTGAPFPGNKIPLNRFDPVSAKLVSTYMPPSSTPSNVLVFPTPPIQLNDDEYSARIDHNLTDAQRLSFRLLDMRYNNPWVVLPNNLYYFNIGSLDSYISAVINYTYVIKPNMVNEFNIGLHHSKALLVPPASLSACCDLVGLGGRVNTVPNNETLATSITGWAGTPEGFHRDQRQTTYLLADNLHYSTGRHQMSFGGEFQRYRIDYTTYFDATPAVTFSGQVTAAAGNVSSANSFADFLLGRFSTFRQQTISGYRLYNNYGGLYAQDDIRFTSKLTANFGLRWMPEFFPHDKYHQDTTFIPGRQSTAFPNAPLGLVFYGDSGIHNPIVPSYWHALSPRIGFAYQVDPKTVVRTAYGIFYDQYMMISSNRGVQAPPWVNQFSLGASGYLSNPYGTGTPISIEHTTPPTNVPFLPYSTFAIPTQQIRPGYVQSWNLVVERQLARDWVVKAAYIGSHGTHLLIAAEINPAIYGPGATLANENARRIYQPIGGLQLGYGEGWSLYNGGQFSLEKRLSHSFLLRANYTVSRSLDIASYGTIEGNNIGPHPYNWNANRGPSDFNIPQRMVVSGVFTHPKFDKQNELVKSVLGGWQSNLIFTAQSGTPLNIVSGVDNSLSGVGGDQADLTGVSSQLPGGRSKTAKIAEWFNTAAFRQNALGTPGNAGRNTLVVPGMWNVDYSLFKRFDFREKAALEFRGEFFNFFNHTNLLAPGATVVSSSFGRITTAAAPRIVQLSLKLTF